MNAAHRNLFIDIELMGHAHDGLEDAYDTGLLIAKLENDPQLQLPEVCSASWSWIYRHKMEKEQ